MYLTLPHCWVIVFVSTLLGHMALAQPHMASRRARTQQLAISAATAGGELEVCVAPGHETSLDFKMPLAPDGVTLEVGRERLKRLSITGNRITLEPATELAPGERLLLTVRFADGRVPERAVLALVSSPIEVDAVVTVVRQPSTMGEVLAELHATRDQLDEAHRQLQAKNARCVPNTLVDVVFSGLLEEGVFSRRDVEQRPEQSAHVDVAQLSVYRSPKRLFLSISLRLRPSFEGTLAPWTADEITLNHHRTSTQVRVLSIEMRPPLLSAKEEMHLVVELEPPPERLTGLFSLECVPRGGKPGLQWAEVNL